jgi:hypothetical protein
MRLRIAFQIVVCSVGNSKEVLRVDFEKTILAFGLQLPVRCPVLVLLFIAKHCQCLNTAVTRVG